MLQGPAEIAIIFGGSSGIGLAIAELLSSRDARVVVADIKPPLGEAPARAFEYFEVDIRNRAAVRSLLQSFPEVDYVFNCAGILREGHVKDIPDEDWDESFSINCTGTINSSVEALKVMAARGSGHIVNLSSSAALFPWPYMLPYVTSKYAILGFSLGLRDEAAIDGINVSVVCPGNVDTPMIGSKIDHLGTCTPAISAAEAAKAIMAGVANNEAVIVFPGYARSFWKIERFLPGRGANLREWSANGNEIQLLPSFLNRRGPTIDFITKVIPQLFVSRSFAEKYLLPFTKFLAIRTRLMSLIAAIKSNEHK